MAKERLSKVQKRILLEAYKNPEKDFDNWGWMAHSLIKEKEYIITKTDLLKKIYGFEIKNRSIGKTSKKNNYFTQYRYGLVLGVMNGEGNEREDRLKEYNKAQVVLTRAIRNLIKKELCFAVSRYGDVYAIKPEENIIHIKEQIKKFKIDEKFAEEEIRKRNEMRKLGFMIMARSRKQKPLTLATKTELLKDWKEQIENIKKYNSAYGIFTIKGIVLTDKGIAKAKEYQRIL